MTNKMGKKAYLTIEDNKRTIANPKISSSFKLLDLRNLSVTFKVKRKVNPVNGKIKLS